MSKIKMQLSTLSFYCVRKAKIKSATTQPLTPQKAKALHTKAFCSAKSLERCGPKKILHKSPKNVKNQSTIVDSIILMC